MGLLVGLAGCAQGLADEELGPDASPGAADSPDSPDGPGPDGSPEPQDSPDPPPDSMDPPEGCASPQWIDLLENGGFDQGAVLWLGDTSAIQTSQMMPIPAENGSHAAWLAGYNGADELLGQAVDVPSSATALRLTGFRCFVSSDPSAADDLLDVELRTPTADLLETLAAYSNQDTGSTCGWEAFTLEAGAAHAGERIVLRFHAQNGGVNPTSFFLDTLVFEAYACP